MPAWISIEGEDRTVLPDLSLILVRGQIPPSSFLIRHQGADEGEGGSNDPPHAIQLCSNGGRVDLALPFRFQMEKGLISTSIIFRQSRSVGRPLGWSPLSDVDWRSTTMARAFGLPQPPSGDQVSALCDRRLGFLVCPSHHRGDRGATHDRPG